MCCISDSNLAATGGSTAFFLHNWAENNSILTSGIESMISTFPTGILVQPQPWGYSMDTASLKAREGPACISFTVRITEHTVVKNYSFKMPLEWHLCPKIKDVKLAITLQVSWAVPQHCSEAERTSGFTRVLCSLPLLLLCALTSESFCLCCHFPGSSWSLTLKPKVSAEICLYIDYNCIFHLLFVLERLSLSKLVHLHSIL